MEYWVQEQEKNQKLVSNFKKKHRLEVEDDSAAVTIHLMNQHRIDENAALDQSSRGADDHGVDGWYFDGKTGDLFIYQSKFSLNKQYVLQGFADIVRAKDWIQQVCLDGGIEKNPANHGLYNLYISLCQNNDKLTKITFVLLSSINENLIEDSREYKNCREFLIKSKLAELKKIDLRLNNYNFDDTSLPILTKSYPVTKFNDSTLTFSSYANLDLGYIPLIQLVDLYRQRGYVLFDKNIRLSISNTKEAKERLVHPMEETLNMICDGQLEPSIFTFYHVGVTIAASKSTCDDNKLMLETPSIINGCQTITIAESFLKGLEKTKNKEKLDKFREIKVIAKIVIGVTDDELRQITNSNNRQNPIDNWQLFSNDLIHVDIEEALECIGVFYERQKGKFFTVMTKTQVAKRYPNTNNTYVGIPDLGQIISLGRRNLQWAAKPSEIFVKKSNHDLIFDSTVPNYARDIVLVWNAFKAMKRALKKVIDAQQYNAEDTTKIFSRPIVRTYAYYVALMYFYQRNNSEALKVKHSMTLDKIASPKLVTEFEQFFPKILGKTRKWYLEESQELTIEVSAKKINDFLETIAVEVGIDLRGASPFTISAINWSELEES